MTDVFVRVFSSNELRLGFAIATVARWRMQKDCRVHVLSWDAGLQYDWWISHKDGEYIGQCVNIPEHPFATWSLKTAEEIAKSDPYIICNDDNLIFEPNFVSKGLAIMEHHLDFGCVSGVVINGHEPYNKDQEITEIHAVGGLVFLRKGLVTEFPPLEDCFWDGERHKQVLNKGYKSGYAPALPFLHMGAHFSIANPSHFNGA